MGSIAAYLVFFFGGAVFANFVPAAKFLLLACALSLSYFAYNLIASDHLGENVIGAIVTLGFIQLGYVAGLALKVAYVSLFSKNILPSTYSGAVEEKTKLK